MEIIYYLQIHLFYFYHLYSLHLFLDNFFNTFKKLNIKHKLKVVKKNLVFLFKPINEEYLLGSLLSFFFVFAFFF